MCRHFVFIEERKTLFTVVKIFLETCEIVNFVQNLVARINLGGKLRSMRHGLCDHILKTLLDAHEQFFSRKRLLHHGLQLR